jgi:hypothetical protein
MQYKNSFDSINDVFSLHNYTYSHVTEVIFYGYNIPYTKT